MLSDTAKYEYMTYDSLFSIFVTKSTMCGIPRNPHHVSNLTDNIRKSGNSIVSLPEHEQCNANRIISRSFPELVEPEIERLNHHNRHDIFKKVRLHVFYAIQYFVLTNYPFIVIDKEWDTPEIWDIKSYSEIATQIIQSPLSLDETVLMEKGMDTNLLGRDPKTQRLIIPGPIFEELDIMVDDFKHRKYIRDILKEVATQAGIDPIHTVSDIEIAHMIFYSCWNIYFQAKAKNPDIIHSKSHDAFRNFDLSEIAKLSTGSGSKIHSVEDQIIMYINGAYTDLADVCFRARSLVKTDNAPREEDHPLLKSIYQQMISNKNKNSAKN